MNKWPIGLGLGALAVVGALSRAQDVRGLVAQLGPGWSNLHPDVQRAARAVIADARREFADTGLTVGIYEGWRTIKRQREVMAAGTSFVSDPLDSYHPWGLAVDFVFIDKLGRWTWKPGQGESCPWWNPFCTDPDRAMWDKLGTIIERHGFEWGGRWRKFDGAHGQMPILNTTALKRAFKTPAEWRDSDLFNQRTTVGF